MIKFLALLILANLSISQTTVDKLCASRQGSTCKECWDSFLFNGACIEPENEVSECVQYLADGQCKLCKDGYRITEDFHCEEIEHEFCIRVNKGNQCVLCEQGMRI